MFKHLNKEIYIYMQGPSEFGISGKLADWDRKKYLSKITVPTLTIGAKYDTMDPEHMKWMSEQVKNGNFLYCREGSHLSMWDNQKAYFPGLMKFIIDVNDHHK